MVVLCCAILRVTLVCFDTQAAQVLLWSKINFYRHYFFLELCLLFELSQAAIPGVAA